MDNDNQNNLHQISASHNEPYFLAQLQPSHAGRLPLLEAKEWLASRLSLPLGAHSPPVLVCLSLSVGLLDDTDTLIMRLARGPSLSGPTLTGSTGWP